MPFLAARVQKEVIIQDWHPSTLDSYKLQAKTSSILSFVWALYQFQFGFVCFALFYSVVFLMLLLKAIPSPTLMTYIKITTHSVMSTNMSEVRPETC